MPKHEPNPLLVSLTPQKLVLVTLYGEVRSEPIEGQIAVANVLHNRLLDGRWGHDYRAVVLAWAQFSCLWPTLGGLNYQRVIDFARLVSSGGLLTRREQQLDWIVRGLFAAEFLDNTYGATHYFADYIPAPTWATGSHQTAKFGRHLFFAGVK